MRTWPVRPGAALVGSGILLGALLAGGSAMAAQDDLRKDVEELKKGQQLILQQLQELKQLIQAQPRPAAPTGAPVKDVVFDLGANAVLGDEKAKVTLVEFTDYQ